MTSTQYDWSKLCSDVIGKILECLATKDYHRARTVCTTWYSISTTCKRPLYPWQLLLNKNSVSLYDPGEDETLEIEHEGIDFTNVNVIASYSNWLLIDGGSLNFYILNVFTRERISLPSMESSFLGTGRFGPTMPWGDFVKSMDMDITASKKPAMLWINEKTRDYVVAWCCKGHYLFTYKKGDSVWCNLEGVHCVGLAYKGWNALCVLTINLCVRVFVLSGDSLVEVGGRSPNPFDYGFDDYRERFGLGDWDHVLKSSVAISNSGDVLIVMSLKGFDEKRVFYVYKMNMENGVWGRVDSLGGEMLMFGHGVTIRAPVKEIVGFGIKGDSVGFLNCDLFPSGLYDDDRTVSCGVFDLATREITKPFDESVSKSFWFVPGYDD